MRNSLLVPNGNAPAAPMCRPSNSAFTAPGAGSRAGSRLTPGRGEQTRTNGEILADKEAGMAGHPSVALEPHFTCKELAAKWHMSETTVFKLFVAEPGVVKIGARNPLKRTKISIRVPLSVAERVHKRMQLG
jgi:hypothetical protein